MSDGYLLFEGCRYLKGTLEEIGKESENTGETRSKVMRKAMCLGLLVLKNEKLLEELENVEVVDKGNKKRRGSKCVVEQDGVLVVQGEE